MTERNTKRAARGERNAMSDNVEHLREATAALWAPAISSERFADLLIGWNEKAAAHLKANRDLGSALGALAQHQGRLFMECAQSFELESPVDGRDLRSMSMKIKPEKVDRLFDEASDILREAHLLMLEAQVNALNLLRPMGLESSPRVVASVEDREAA